MRPTRRPHNAALQLPPPPGLNLSALLFLQAGLGTTLRCAGGWVRDKLMGRRSLDIDIALDNLLGRVFAERVNEYLKAHVRISPPFFSRFCICWFV